MKWKNRITVIIYFFSYIFIPIETNLFATDKSSDDDEYEGEDKPDAEADEDQNNGDQDDEEDEQTGVNWRDNLAQKARTSYLERQSNTKNLMKIVYGMFNEVSVQ